MNAVARPHQTQCDVRVFLDGGTNMSTAGLVSSTGENPLITPSGISGVLRQIFGVVHHERRRRRARPVARGDSGRDEAWSRLSLDPCKQTPQTKTTEASLPRRLAMTARLTRVPPAIRQSETDPLRIPDSRQRETPRGFSSLLGTEP